MLALISSAPSTIGTLLTAELETATIACIERTAACTRKGSFRRTPRQRQRDLNTCTRGVRKQYKDHRPVTPPSVSEFATEIRDFEQFGSRALEANRYEGCITHTFGCPCHLWPGGSPIRSLML